MVNKGLTSLISIGNFTGAFEIVTTISSQELRDSILNWTYDNESISGYAFYSYILSRSDMAIFHYYAAELLVTALSHIAGAYPVALFHARKAIELAPQEIEYKEFLLLFATTPYEVMSKDEGIAIAKGILDANSSNETAKAFIQRYQAH